MIGTGKHGGGNAMCSDEVGILVRVTERMNKQHRQCCHQHGHSEG